MTALRTLPRGTGAVSPSTAGSGFSSPNASQANRERGRQARTSQNSRSRTGGTNAPGQNARRSANLTKSRASRARQPHLRTRGSTAGSRSLPGTNARRGANLRNARAAQNPLTAPRTASPASPSAPIVKAAPALGAGGTGAAAAGGSIWTASPAAAPGTAIGLGAAAAGAGLGVGNAIYENLLDRPFGPSLGDHIRRAFAQRDGSSQEYPGVGETPPFSGGQGVGTSYVVRAVYDQIYTPTGSSTAKDFIYATLTGPVSAVFLENTVGSRSISAIANGRRVNMRFGTGSTTAWVNLRDITFERVGGSLDPGTDPFPLPQPVSPNNPYSSPPYSPTPLLDPRPAPSPLQPSSPRRPLSSPDSTPEPVAPPLPELRPDSNENPFPIPFPPLIPFGPGGPTPTQTQTPNPTAPPAPTTPPSSRRRPDCGCNGGVISGVNDRLNPIRQAQQSQAAGLAAEAASSGVILERLATMQQFAEKAWSNTKLQKLINYLTLISVLHNAAMLSRDVGSTMGELTSNMLAAVGIKDENGSQIDINELVSGSVENFIKGVVGADVYDDVSTAWQKSSRIVQAASMIVYTVRSINDTSKDVLEWSAENLGKIGNALKRFGVVGERSYPWMSERVKTQDVYRKKFERFTDGLEQLEDTASSLSEVTGNVRDIQEEYASLKEQKDAFTELVSATPPAAVATAAPESVPVANTESAAKADSESADVAIADAQKGS